MIPPACFADTAYYLALINPRDALHAWTVRACLPRPWGGRLGRGMLSGLVTPNRDTIQAQAAPQRILIESD